MAMALRSVSCSCSILFLSLQLLVMIHEGVAIRDLDNKDTNILRLPSSMEQGMEHHHHHHHHASNNQDQTTMIFFTLKDLYQGNSLPIYFPKRNPNASPKLLPRDEADSIPFALKALPYLLSFFSFSPNSPQASAMEATLSECETAPIEGETKLCATSLESMLDFVRGVFRKMDEETTLQFKAIATVHVTESNTHFQNYTIVGVDEVPAPKTVSCHTMPYPYTVFYCHHQTSESRVFRVSLGGENGDEVAAVAVCHLDTSHWSRKHPAFGVLGIEPGESHVCHFFPADNFVWVPVVVA